MKRKDSQRAATKSKEDCLGWTPRNEVRKTNVCLLAKGEIGSASVCHISAFLKMTTMTLPIICANILFLPYLRRLFIDNLRKCIFSSIFAQKILQLCKK